MDAADTRSYTAYHHACAGGHAKCVALLVLAGCNTACVTDANKTGWELAVETHKTEVVSTLTKLSEMTTQGKKPARSSKSSGKGPCCLAFLADCSLEPPRFSG